MMFHSLCDLGSLKKTPTKNIPPVDLGPQWDNRPYTLQPTNHCLRLASILKALRHSSYFYFLFFIPLYRKYIVFWSKFRNGNFDGFIHFEVLWIRKPKYSTVDLCVCMCTCVSNKRNSKTNYSRYFKFSILHLCHM